MDATTYESPLALFCKKPGKQTELARALGITPSAVNQWVTGHKPIPADRCPAIERATSGAVKCEDLRPDVDWGYLRQSCVCDKKAAA